MYPFIFAKRNTRKRYQKLVRLVKQGGRVNRNRVAGGRDFPGCAFWHSFAFVPYILKQY